MQNYFSFFSKKKLTNLKLLCIIFMGRYHVYCGDYTWYVAEGIEVARGTAFGSCPFCVAMIRNIGIKSYFFFFFPVYYFIILWYNIV